MPNKNFVTALERKPQKVPPIWMMRQAGRYHSHYQSLKKTHTFEELCKSPALAAETAMGPIEDFDFDVAILFSDILFPLESLGMNLSYNPGPQFAELLTEKNAFTLLNQKDPINSLDFQAEAIERTLERLPENKSMIGFIGGPWTLLSYSMGLNKEMKLDSLNNFHWQIMEDKIMPLLKANIALQISAGAEIVMIFDSAAHQLNSSDFERYLRMTFSILVSAFSNRIGYYAKDGVNYSLIESIKVELCSPLAGLGIDANQSIIPFFTASRTGFIQGNFDEKIINQPGIHFLKKLDQYIREISNCSEDDRAGWVCGLGHGILKTTPEENVRLFVKKIREAFV